MLSRLPEMMTREIEKLHGSAHPITLIYRVGARQGGFWVELGYVCAWVAQ